MPDYPAIAVQIKDGLAGAGATMTLRRLAKGIYDRAAGAFLPVDVDTDYSVVGICVSGGNPTSTSGQRFFNNVLVQTDDRVVLIAASGLAITPAPGDRLIIGSEIWNIISQVSVNPGTVNLMFRLLLRK